MRDKDHIESAEPLREASDGGPDKRPEEGRFKRLTGETKNLVDDLKEWVDLKIQLIQLDFEDRVRQAANQAALTAVVIVIGLLAVLFGLIAAGEALGAWFDSRSLGFLALAVILALVATAIHLAKPRLVERAAIDEEDQDEGERERLTDRSEDVPALPTPDMNGEREHSNQSHSSGNRR